MDAIWDAIGKLGLGIALSGVMAYLLRIVLVWLIGDFNKKIDNLTAINIQLINRINGMDRDVSNMADKMDYKRPPLTVEVIPTEPPKNGV